MLKYLKLKLTNCSKQKLFIFNRFIQLNGPFLNKLSDPFMKMLLLHDVFRRYSNKQLWRKLRQFFILKQRLPSCQCITNLVGSCIIKTNDVPTYGFVHSTAI